MEKIQGGTLITNGIFLKWSEKSNNLHFYLSKKGKTLIQNINTEHLIDKCRVVLLSYLGVYLFVCFGTLLTHKTCYEFSKWHSYWRRHFIKLFENVPSGTFIWDGTSTRDTRERCRYIFGGWAGVYIPQFSPQAYPQKATSLAHSKLKKQTPLLIF